MPERMRSEAFTVQTLEGNKVRISDFVWKANCLGTGSLTCPVYAGVVNEMNRIGRGVS
ncbi:MAG: hypothetical protein H0X62_09400 [Bacteroidetes bacterium]|nr:hypothetical protein [Bacteroidota bacterium]